MLIKKKVHSFNQRSMTHLSYIGIYFTRQCSGHSCHTSHRRYIKRINNASVIHTVALSLVNDTKTSRVQSQTDLSAIIGPRQQRIVSFTYFLSSSQAFEFTDHIIMSSYKILFRACLGMNILKGLGSKLYTRSRLSTI